MFTKIKTWIANITTKGSEFFKDGTGMLSSMRLIFIIWSLGVFLVWVGFCIFKKSIVGIDNSIIEIFGVLTTGKISQSYTESLTSDNPTPPIPPAA